MAKPFFDIKREGKSGEELAIRLRGNTFQYGDKFVDLYRIGQLGKVVGRKASTIRMWEGHNEKKGLVNFPRPKWKVETSNKFLNNPGGQAVERFYSEAQLQMIDTLVLKYGVYGQVQSQAINPRFFEEVNELFYTVDDLED